jgi:hypothetical protein
MSQRAVDYVLDPGSDRVTVAQKLLLLAIAEHHSERYGSTNINLDDLCAQVLRTRRHLVRVLKNLDQIIEYKPGVGSGNFSQFRFLELSAKVTERCHKGDIFATAIRKEDLNPEQNLISPTPLSCTNCNGTGLIHQQPHLPGPRLIPCDHCGHKPPERVSAA